MGTRTCAKARAGHAMGSDAEVAEIDSDFAEAARTQAERVQVSIPGRLPRCRCVGLPHSHGSPVPLLDNPF